MTHQRPLRVLIGKPGLDGHDKGAKVIAHTLRDAGCEVIYTGLHKTVDQIVEAALQEDVDIIGLSVLSGAHLDLTAKLMQRLQAEEMSDIVILIGGNIPHGDRPKLLELGANAVFPTASSLDDIIAFVKSINPR
jgi:methylmalonyl-CoA mutase C-terminal domain/subunit